MKSKFHLEQFIINTILLFGVLLTVIQFFFNRSLWLDEGYLALNIINKDHFELLRPLDNLQVAPILFLQIEKTFSELIPNSEFGLRLFPLISFFLSLYFFYNIVKTIHTNNYTIIFSLSLFVFNITLVYYSNEVKQYMTDVFILAFVYYLILKNYRNQILKYYYLAIVGAVSIFFSNVSPIILFTGGLYLTYEIYQNNKKHFPYLIFVSIIYTITFSLYYLFFINNHPSKDLQVNAFGNVFMPINPFKIDFYKFILGKTWMIVISLFRFGKIGGICLSVLIFLGIISLFRKGKLGIIILTITPFIIHLIISSLKLYPFERRLILYTIPCIIIICSFGFNYFVTYLSNRYNIITRSFLSIIIPLIMFTFLLKDGFPIEYCQIKRSISFIEQNRHENDKIYVNHLSKIPFQYYYDISFSKINKSNIIVGKDTDFSNEITWTVDSTRFSDELNMLRGRVWFLFTWVGDEAGINDFLLKYYHSKRECKIQEFHTKGSFVYLFDITEIIP